jgi:hypothetical protein
MAGKRQKRYQGPEGVNNEGRKRRSDRSDVGFQLEYFLHHSFASQKLNCAIAAIHMKE